MAQEGDVFLASLRRRLSGVPEPETEPEVQESVPLQPEEDAFLKSLRARVEPTEQQTVTVAGGGVVQPAPPLPEPVESQLGGMRAAFEPGDDAPSLPFGGVGTAVGEQQGRLFTNAKRAGRRTLDFVPIVAGVVDTGEMIVNFDELVEDFKEAPLQTALFTVIRLGANALDFLPIGAFVRVGIKQGLRQGLKAGASSLSGKAARRKAQEAASARVTSDLGTDLAGLAPARITRKPLAGQGLIKETAAATPPRRWKKIKKNDLGVTGISAEFAGPASRTGSALIRKTNGKQFRAQISLGPEQVEVGTFRTIREAKQAVADMASSRVRQADALDATQRMRAGQPTNPASKNAAVRAAAATRGAVRSGDEFVQDIASTERVRDTAGEVYEVALSREGIGAHNRSLEAGSRTGTAIARTAKQDAAVETANYFDELAELGKSSGWLKATRTGGVVVRNKKLNREIFDVLNGDIPIEDASKAAQDIVPRLQEDYLRRGIELKTTPGFEDMNLRDNYVTWADDPNKAFVRQQFKLPTMERRYGRNVAFGFRLARKGDTPALRDAWLSVSAYHEAAIRAKHSQRALRQLEPMRKAAEDAGNEPLAWTIDQIEAVLRGTGHDPVIRDARSIASAVEFASAGRWKPDEKEIVRNTAIVMSNLYRGLLYARPGVAIDQFTQFTLLAADIGGGSTARGIGAVARSAVTPAGIAGGARNLATPASATGAAIGGALGFVAAGPVGAAVGAALIPAARTVKGAVAASISRDIATRIGVTDASRLLRGSDFIKPARSLMRHLDEVGFSDIDAAETVLRGGSFYGGLDAAARLGMTGREAVDFAIGVADKTQFTYDQLSRNPFFRHSVMGRVAAPLSSIQPKILRFTTRIMTEGASDGASPAVAMTRYLFYNGLIAQVLRESTRAATGEELVPRAMQGRIEPAFLPFGVDAPAGFQTVAGLSPTRTPGPDIAGAFVDWMQGDRRGMDLTQRFIRSFMPFGLIVGESARASQRIEGQVQRQQEGLASGRPLDPSESRGGVVRETTTTRELARLFSFVSPEEGRRRDLERFARGSLEDLRKESTQFLNEANRSLRSRRNIDVSSPAAKRVLASGTSRRDAISRKERTGLSNSLRSIPVVLREVIEAEVNGDPTALGVARELGLTRKELANWVMIWGIVEAEFPRELERIKKLDAKVIRRDEQ